MLLHTASHLYVQTNAEGDFRREWEELLHAPAHRTLIDPPLREPRPFTTTGRPPTPKRQYKDEWWPACLAMFPIHQAAFNMRLDGQLRAFGWSSQPITDAVIWSPERPFPNNLLGDFAKGGIFVEVEFGNMASAFRDSFQVPDRESVRRGRLGVLVVATRSGCAVLRSGRRDLSSR